MQTTAFISDSEYFKGIKKQASLVSEVLGCLGKYELTFWFINEYFINYSQLAWLVSGEVCSEVLTKIVRYSECVYCESRHRSRSAKTPESYKLSTSLFSLHTCTCLEILQVCSYSVKRSEGSSQAQQPSCPSTRVLQGLRPVSQRGLGLVSQYFLSPAPPWRAVLLPLPLTLFSHITSDSPHLIWSLIPAWRRARGWQGEGPVDLLLKECLSSQICPPQAGPLFSSFIHLSLTSLGYKPKALSSVWGDHSGGILRQNHQHILRASGQNTIKGVNAGVERKSDHYLGSQILVGLLLLASLQREGFEKLAVMPLVILRTFPYSITTELPLLFICVPSSLDHKLLTAGNVSESCVFPEPSSVHCTWLVLSKAFRKKCKRCRLKPTVFNALTPAFWVTHQPKKCSLLLSHSGSAETIFYYVEEILRAQVWQ